MTNEARCHVCGSGVSAVDEFASMRQVTSDCRVWTSGGSLTVCRGCGLIQKPVTDEWLLQVAEIYRGYQMYSQGGGAETIIFQPGAGAGDTRSGKVLQWLEKHAPLPEDGSLLDVGCGTGSFLREFGKQHPDWTLAGSEYSDQNKKALEAIPGVGTVYVGDPADIGEKFDLIVMIHSLEHIPDARSYLSRLAGLLKPDGLLFVDVPDIENTPFDILVADHCSHFTWSSLNRILGAAGLVRVAGEQDAIPKEMFLLTTHSESDGPESARRLPPVPQDDLKFHADLARAHCAWLREIVLHAESIPGNVGIFGSSISATWLASSLGEKVTCFVDEDSNRLGRAHMGLPIYGVSDAPKGEPVLMPLRRDIAEAISVRLAREGVDFVLPPRA